MKTQTVIFSFKNTFVLYFVVFVILFSSCKTTQKGTSDSSRKNSKELSYDDKRDFEYRFFNGNKEKILGNFDLAETYFSQALKIDPNSAATLYELANIYAYQKNKTQALNYSKKAASLDPNNIWYQLLYADCLKQNKQPKEVAAVFETLIKNNPEHLDFYYELGNAYLISNNVNDALKTYDKIEAHFGVTEDASMQKLKIYKATKNFDKALKEIQKLLKAFPKEAKYYGMLGELYQENGMNDKAFEAYNDLLKIDPSNPFVHLSLADYYRNQKQNTKAFGEIKTAFKSKDLDIDTKIKIMLSYYEITDKYPELKPDADTLCKILIDVHPDEAKAFAMYGDFLFRDKKNEEARTQYRKAISIDKEKFALWENLLFVESYLNDINALQKESKDAIDLFPNQPLPYYFNGIANIQIKNFREAVESLKEGKEFVIENKPLLAEFYAYLGDAENGLKNYAASDSAYDKFLELDSKSALYVSVLNNYAYYLSLRNVNLDKAEEMSKKSNELTPNNNSYLDTYGWILYQKKKYDDAKVWVGKALDNGGRNNGTLLEHYGDILFKLGEIDNAIKYWIDAKKAGGASDLIDKKIADRKLYE